MATNGQRLQRWSEAGGPKSYLAACPLCMVIFTCSVQIENCRSIIRLMKERCSLQIMHKHSEVGKIQCQSAAKYTVVLRGPEQLIIWSACRTDNAVKNRWASLTKKNPRLAHGSPSSVPSASADSSFSGSMPSQSRSAQSNSVSMQPTRLPGIQTPPGRSTAVASSIMLAVAFELWQL